jgi:hypothetical protein
LAILISPFRSKSRLEAENAVLRHQLIVVSSMREPCSARAVVCREQATLYLSILERRGSPFLENMFARNDRPNSESRSQGLLLIALGTQVRHRARSEKSHERKNQKATVATDCA